MDARIMDTYAVLVPECDMEMLKGHKSHFEELKAKTGYLQEAEIYCYELVLKRINELEDETKESENPVPAQNEPAN
jgi:hypothetical protein